MSKGTEQSREAFEKATLLTDLVIWDGKKFVNSRNTNAAKAFAKRVNDRWSGWHARDAEYFRIQTGKIAKSTSFAESQDGG